MKSNYLSIVMPALVAGNHFTLSFPGKAGNPVLRSVAGVTGSPAFAGDDTACDSLRTKSALSDAVALTISCYFLFSTPNSIGPLSS